MKLINSRGVVSALAAGLILAVMATSFAAGISIGHQDSHEFVIAGTPVPDNLQQPLSDLWTAYESLNADSYWRPFDRQQLIYGAINGMMQSSHLQDTHTIFLPPVNSQYQTKVLNEGLYGIGAQVSMTSAGLEIDAPYFDSPAMKAGLLQGDIITKVNGTAIQGMTADAAVSLIHGNAGTAVNLTIIRKGQTKPLTVKVIRGSIPTVIISAEGAVGYLEFTEFGLNTAGEVHGALTRLLTKDHVTKLVLDLRGNPGGYVTTARSIASEFLAKNSVIWWDRTKTVTGAFNDVANKVTSPGVALHIPLVVLVDENTASAAEILTAALRENGRAHVVGSTTYGKGSEQESKTLPDGSGLRITTTLWLTPDKHQVDNAGIKPDIAIQRGNGSQDAQLQRAVQYLLKGR